MTMRIASFGVDAETEAFLREKVLSIRKDVSFYSYAQATDFLIDLEDEGREWNVIFYDYDRISTQIIENGIECRHLSFDSVPEVMICNNPENYLRQHPLIPDTLKGILIKPVTEDHLAELCEIILSDEVNLHQARFVFRQSRKLVSLGFEEIRYIESRGHKIYIYTENGRYSAYEKLKEARLRLPPQFLQCHKSYLVNAFDIINFSEKAIELRCGVSLPVSRRFQRSLKQEYEEFLHKLNRQ